MPKAPSVRAELGEFLSEHTVPGPDGEATINGSITQLSAEWDKWRISHRLKPSTVGSRAFRQALSTMESLGLLIVQRKDRSIVGMALSKPPAPGNAERYRSIERERALLAGRFIELTPDAEKDLLDMRTPKLNEYAHRRYLIERYNRTIQLSAGKKKVAGRKVVLDRFDPLGDEALALKERVARNAMEIMAWRILGAQHGITPEMVNATIAAEIGKAKAGTTGLAGRKITEVTKAKPRRKLVGVTAASGRST